MSAFKVGDRVRVKSKPEMVGTVKRFVTPWANQDENIVVVTLGKEFAIRRFESELELVPKPVIVKVGDKLSTVGANTFTIIGLSPVGPGMVWLLDDDDVRRGHWGPGVTRKLPYTFTVQVSALFDPSHYTTEDGRKIDGVSYR